MINVTQNEDGSFEISWDENDPKESILNDYTQEDFQNIIRNFLEQQKCAEEYTSFAAKQRQNTTESQEESTESNISEATSKDWEDFWEEK